MIRCGLRPLLGALLLASCATGEVSPPPVASSPAHASPSSAVAPTEVRVLVHPELAEHVRRFDVDLFATLRDAVAHASSFLPPRDRGVSVNASVNPGSPYLIPGWGLGARADAHGITVVVDPDSPDLATGLSHLPVLLAHETHHAWRFSAGSGFPQGLLDRAVAEGLADRFAGEVYPDADAPPWTRAIEDDELARWWKAMLAAHEPDVHSRVDQQWFYGGGDVPPWTGYTLGYHVVGDYLQRTGATAAGSWDVPWETVVDGAGGRWNR